MPKKERFQILYALSFAWQLGFLIAAPLGILIFLGFWVDKIFHSGPFFVLVGIMGGIVVTIVEVYQMLVPLIHNNHKHD